MARLASSMWALALALFTAVSGCLAATVVVVNGTASHAIPSTLFGQMFEDINVLNVYSVLQNRAFQQVTPNTTAALDAWHPVNGASINVIKDPKPVSAALPNSLQLKIPSGQNGRIGFSNEGFWGIKVDAAWTYTASFFFKFPNKSNFRGSFTIALQTSSGKVLASKSVGVSGSTTSWTRVQVQLRPSTSAKDTKNNFVVTVNSAGGQTIDFAMFSLFPPTFKNRPNGMRIDIAETLVEMGPSFFRFPGGNNLEVVATRWQWNATVGSLLDRPGRVGDWGYVNTDGLGLLEYLTFFEDAGMEPIMAVWAGYALGGTNLAENQLAPYIAQARDQINFVIGDPKKSAPAALRASLGHPKPFALRYIEVGNEDFFAAATYPYRWRDIVANLSAEFPQLQFIATTNTFDPLLSPNPTQYDVHVYQTPGWFAENAFMYDGFERNGTTYFEGEYAAISTNSSNIFGTPETGRLPWPTMQSSTGEAAFMTGLERNSDIVFAASYAPLLQTPDLISFDAGQVYKSTSFYAQKLFSVNRGDEYLPSTLPSRNGTLFWSVTRSKSSRSVIIKISNTVATAAEMSFRLPFRTVESKGTLQQLHGGQTASNTPAQPHLVVPVTSSIRTGKTFNFNAPGFSVNVITIKVA
ncbi:glycoside hydrolase family 51 protein [Cristinia sonorae]|uniref:non-reducing end alpha-L-arabinofuranosidase n=1 Tax=Cristinia sonorae TaxID=1940300 RepID=A0A8K0UEY2_9AGAR|nr:glycoside hydrolase family 51 protein [Cristinia sonorae]